MGARRSVAWIILQQFFLIGFGVLQTAIVSRALGPTGRGILYFNMTLAGTIPMFLLGGMHLANTYYLGTGKADRNTVLSNTLWYGLFMGLFGVILHFGIYKLYGQEVVEALTLQQKLAFASITFFVVQNSLWSGVLLAEERFGRRTLTTLLPSAIYLGFVVPMFIKGDLDFYWIVVFTVMSQIVGAGMAILFSLPFRILLPSWKTLKPVLVFGSVPFIADLLQWSVYRADTYFLGVQRPPADLGLYAVAQGLGEMLWIVPGAVSAVLLPLQTKREESAQTPLTLMACRIHFTIVLFLAVFMAGFAIPIIRIVFSAPFVGAANPLWWLIPGCVIAVIPKTLWTEFGARGRYGICLKAAAFACGMNLLLNYPLIERFGTAGAALATTVSYLVGALIQMVEYRKMTGARWSEFFLPSREDFEVAILAPLRRVVSRSD